MSLKKENTYKIDKFSAINMWQTEHKAAVALVPELKCSDSRHTVSMDTLQGKLFSHALP